MDLTFVTHLAASSLSEGQIQNSTRDIYLLVVRKSARWEGMRMLESNHQAIAVATRGKCSHFDRARPLPLAKTGTERVEGADAGPGRTALSMAAGFCLSD
jgi:hypothetical protein